MRTAWLMVGVCASIGVACSSFNGSDAPPGEAPDGGSTDDGGAEAGMITGQVPDNTTGGISAAGVVASQGARVRVQSDGRVLALGSGTITRFWD